ncbi:hypothetical protein H310_13035 [Aphanomyces invadans]|nr:hypothetical protein H310_13035 [Aphanomyces invadans]ETV92842.1 hypothetical protein H310_13035 [Aphanomyces invadans]|eukprot:XP_008878612.1 hypothetical protein H310_13035 [Aphanomyces invadans]
MKRSAATAMKRSYSCMDLAALEATDTAMMSAVCAKRRLTIPPRYRSLSSCPTTRDTTRKQWLHAYDCMTLSLPIVETAAIEDVLCSSSISSVLPFVPSTPTKDQPDSMQLELLELFTHAWIEKDHPVQEDVTSRTL